jgi:hypothetical protein
LFLSSLSGSGIPATDNSAEPNKFFHEFIGPSLRQGERVRLPQVCMATVGMVTHAHWIWMAALLDLWRMVMDYGIAPRVLEHKLEIHPPLAIFTVMVGAAGGGIAGIYLSVLFVATSRVVWRSSPRERWNRRGRVQRQWAPSAWPTTRFELQRAWEAVLSAKT